MTEKEWPPNLFVKRILEVTSDTRTGCILRAMFHDPRDYLPRYDRKAIITSDGYLMCGYTDRHGNYHPGAFVGSAFELTRNLIALCVFAKLSGDEILALGDAADEWIGTDYRPGASSPPRLILDTEESERASQGDSHLWRSSEVTTKPRHPDWLGLLRKCQAFK